MPERFRVPILEHRQAAAGHWEMVLPLTGGMRAATPGQFVNVLCRGPGSCDPLLRRPFSLYRVTDETFSFLYRVIGRGTTLLSRMKAGESVDFVGPLGRGFSFGDLTPSDRVAVVGGGVGVPPLFHLSRSLAETGIAHDVMVGFASRDQVVAVSEWQAEGVPAAVTTDDGSMGRRGFVTELLAERLPEGRWKRVFACGPKPMLKEVARLCRQAGVSCQVAMEEWMGCGIGVCLSCVCPVRAPGASNGEDDVEWVRICREGPVLDGSRVVWDLGERRA